MAGSEPRYRLDPSSHKAVCPQCGRRRFVNYVDRHTLEPLAAGECGRCDRENSCGYHLPPREFSKLRAESLGLRGPGQLRYAPGRVTTVSQSLSFQPSALSSENSLSSQVEASARHYELNPLARWLQRLFEGSLDPGVVERVMHVYRLGTSTKTPLGPSAVFWQIDALGRVRGGKIMAYDPLTGHRLKPEGRPAVMWHHALKGLGMSAKASVSNCGGEGMSAKASVSNCRGEGMSAEASVSNCRGEKGHSANPSSAIAHQLRQCLWGSHVAARHPEATVWVFESEKGALVTALVLEMLGSQTSVCVATGGCAGLNVTSLADPMGPLEVLRGRRVVLFPDQGKYDDWRAKAQSLRGFCESVTVSDIMERWTPDPFNPIGYSVAPGDGPDDLFAAHVPGPVDYLCRLVCNSY